MQLVGPYRLIKTLGTCQVGSVWAAVDAAGGQVTVAMLDEAVASDPRWRDAFSSTANALAQAGDMRAIHADFTASSPWVAVVANAGRGADLIFVALGQDYHPVAEAVQPAAFVPQAQAGSPIPTSPALISPAPVVPGSVPISAGPSSGGPTSGGPSSGGPIAGQWGPPDIGATQAAREPRRRTAIVVGVAALLVLLLGAGTAVIKTTLRPPGPGPAVATTRTASPAPLSFITPAPGQPGREPPNPQAWPNWPVLGPSDKKQTVTTLDFAFLAPERWKCVITLSAPGFARQNCRVATPSGEVIADILIRECPFKCDSVRRDYLRKVEEAWGRQWIETPDNSFWAEVSDLEGGERYGLVMVLFGRTGEDAPIDREVVYRATAPQVESFDVRRVANSIRDAILSKR